jgi:hypothetical protein
MAPEVDLNPNYNCHLALHQKMNVIFEQRSAELYKVLCLVEKVVIALEIVQMKSANYLI